MSGMTDLSHNVFQEQFNCKYRAMMAHLVGRLCVEPRLCGTELD